MHNAPPFHGQHQRMDLHVYLEDETTASMRIIIQQQEQIMTTLQELKDAQAQLATDIAAEKAEVQAKLADLATQIQALKDQIAAGGVVTEQDMADLLTATQAADTSVKDISEPAPPTPAP